MWLHVELLHGARSPKYLRRLGSDTVNLTKLVRYFYMTNTFYHKIQTCSVYNNPGSIENCSFIEIGWFCVGRWHIGRTQEEDDKSKCSMIKNTV